MRKSTEIKVLSEKESKPVIEVVASTKSLESAVSYIKSREVKGNQTMLEIAYKLGKIRSDKLYESKYDSFKDFAKQELGYAKSTASELATVGERFTLLDKGKVICKIQGATVAKLTAVISLDFSELCDIDFTQSRDEIRKQVVKLKNAITQKEQEVKQEVESESEIELKANREVTPVKTIKTINYSLVKDIEGIILKIQKSDFYGDNELKSLVNTYIQDLESELK